MRFVRLSVVLTILLGPAHAALADSYVFPGGMIAATIAGITAASTPANGPPAPPAPYYGGPEGYAGRGPFGTTCWIEPSQTWNGYGTIVIDVRSCR